MSAPEAAAPDRHPATAWVNVSDQVSSARETRRRAAVDRRPKRPAAPEAGGKPARADNRRPYLTSPRPCQAWLPVLRGYSLARWRRLSSIHFCSGAPCASCISSRLLAIQSSGADTFSPWSPTRMSSAARPEFRGQEPAELACRESPPARRPACAGRARRRDIAALSRSSIQPASGVPTARRSATVSHIRPSTRIGLQRRHRR